MLGVTCQRLVRSARASSAHRRMATAPPPAGNPRVCLLQLLVGDDKTANLAGAQAAITAAATAGADIIVLPECFNSPYATDKFPIYAEAIPRTRDEINAAAHPSMSMLSVAAAESKVFLVGGSIPERDASGRIYNTCVAFGPAGEVLAVHRKVHLFDIDVPGRIAFRESDTLSPGSHLSHFDTPWGRVGLGICYDIRFPQLALLLRAAGCALLLFPGAFNTVTGPAHWELLQRARAVDTQCFVAAVSIARNPESAYAAWGHSTVVNPWGEVLATTGHEPATVCAELDMARLRAIRDQIPVGKQARGDLYSLEWTGGDNTI